MEAPQSDELWKDVFRKELKKLKVNYEEDLASVMSELSDLTKVDRKRRYRMKHDFREEGGKVLRLWLGHWVEVLSFDRLFEELRKIHVLEGKGHVGLTTMYESLRFKIWMKRSFGEAFLRSCESCSRRRHHEMAEKTAALKDGSNKLQTAAQGMVSGLKAPPVSKLYTKTGDNGESSLLGNIRRHKSAPQFKVMGSIDELNSSIGVAVCDLTPYLEVDSQQGFRLSSLLRYVQTTLIDSGTAFASIGSGNVVSVLPSFTKYTAELERVINLMDAKLPALSEFVLPGSSTPDAQLHVCRSICRRAERQAWKCVAKTANVAPGIQEVCQYLNRLADFFFAASRYTAVVITRAGEIPKGSSQLTAPEAPLPPEDLPRPLASSMPTTPPPLPR